MSENEYNVDMGLNMELNMIDDMKGKALKGRKDYLFLINDSSSEIKQHYDPTFKPRIDIEKFKESQESKEKYFKKNNINYKLFIVPDKSVVLRHLLPFETPEPIRILDELKDHLTVLDIIQDEEDFIKPDTHIDTIAGIKCVAQIFSIMYPEKTYEEHLDNIYSVIHFSKFTLTGNLLSNINWGYSKDDDYYKKYKYVDLEVPKLNTAIENLTDQLPEEFKFNHGRKTLYFRNENSITDKKAFICRTSSVNKMNIALISHYREIIFYWDHWLFNKEFYEWFKPDDAFDIYIERYLENPSCPIINEDTDDVYIPIKVIFEYMQRVLYNEQNNKILFTKMRREAMKRFPPLSDDIINSIVKQNLFDENFYKNNYTDIEKSEIDPFKHFINYGYKEGRLTSDDEDINQKLNFIIRTHDESTSKRLAVKDKFMKESLNRFPPLTEEVIETIKSENLFDESFYLKRYPDIKRSNLNAFNHFIKQGYKAGRLPTGNKEKNERVNKLIRNM